MLIRSLNMSFRRLQSLKAFILLALAISVGFFLRHGISMHYSNVKNAYEYGRTSLTSQPGSTCSPRNSVTNKTYVLRDAWRINKTIKYEPSTNYLLQPAVCSTSKCHPFLLAVQLSVADRLDSRQNVRDTWGSVARTEKWPHSHINAQVKVMFVLARKGSSNIPMSVVAEAKKFGDILFLDMLDSYQSLTLKIVSALRWVTDNCAQTEFVLKVDEDTFVNMPLLLDVLIMGRRSFGNAMLGYPYTVGGIVHRRGKWAVRPQSYPYVTYPLYASGCGYILGRQALQCVVDKSPYLPLLPIEDVFVTGILRIACNVPLLSSRNVRHFTYFADSSWNTCEMLRNQKLLGTNTDGHRAKEIWRLFTERGGHCLRRDAKARKILGNGISFL